MQVIRPSLTLCDGSLPGVANGLRDTHILRHGVAIEDDEHMEVIGLIETNSILIAKAIPLRPSDP